MKNNELADALESKIGAATSVRIGRVFAEEIIKALRADSVGTVRRGRWEYNTDSFTPHERCTVCGYNKPLCAGESVRREPKHYCPNCGAKMDVPEKE